MRNLRATHPTDPRVIVLEGLVDLKQGRREDALAALARGQQLGVLEAARLLQELAE